MELLEDVKGIEPPENSVQVSGSIVTFFRHVFCTPTPNSTEDKHKKKTWKVL